LEFPQAQPSVSRPTMQTQPPVPTPQQFPSSGLSLPPPPQYPPPSSYSQPAIQVATSYPPQKQPSTGGHMHPQRNPSTPSLSPQYGHPVTSGQPAYGGQQQYPSGYLPPMGRSSSVGGLTRGVHQVHPVQPVQPVQSAQYSLPVHYVDQVHKVHTVQYVQPAQVVQRVAPGNLIQLTPQPIPQDHPGFGRGQSMP